MRRDELRAVDASSGSYNALSRQLNESRKRYKDLAVAGQELTKEGFDLRREITAIDKQLKNIDASVGQFQRNVGGYSEALGQFFPRLSGGLSSVGQGFQAAQGAAGAFNKSLGVFLIAITLFNEVSAAVGAATEAAKEYNEIAAKVSNVQQLTNEQLKESVGTIVAIGRTYKAESTDIINAANTLSKELGTSYEDALTLIEAGFRKGANAQGDFLDQLREYPAQFAAAGGSAAQFVDILIKAQQEGIYSDKGIDAVKEFGLRIREQTTATKTALEGAFGRKFTDDLFKGINNGSITTVEALKRIGKGLQDTSLTAQQVQTVIADTFGGAGEDAGLRFLQLLGDIDDEVQGVTESTNEYQTQQQRLFEANNNLAQAQAELALALKSTSTEFELLKTRAQTFVANVGVAILRFFDRVPIIIAGASAAIKEFLRGNFGGALAAGADAIARESARVAKENAEALAVIEAEEQERAKEQASKSAKARGKVVGEKFIEGSIAGIQARKGELEKAIARAVAGSDAQRRLLQELDKVEKQLEAAVEQQNRARLEAFRKADQERLGQIRQIGTLLINAQVQQEKKTTDAVLAEVKRRNAERSEIERQQAAEFAQLQQEQTQEALNASVGVFFSSLDAFIGAANERRNAILEQQAAQTEARIADLEAKAQATTGIRRRLLEKTIEQEKKLLEQQQANALEAQKKQAKQEKRLATFQAIIFGALAFQKALASSVFPANLINAALVAVQTAAQLAVINAQPLARGGVVGISGRKVTDTQNMPTRRNGDNVLATVKRGEVVLNQRQQAALGGARTFKAIRVPGFTDGGPIGAPISSPRLPGVDASGGMAAITALDRKTDAINARVDRLRAYVVTDDITKDIADGESIRVKAEL